MSSPKSTILILDAMLTAFRFTIFIKFVGNESIMENIQLGLPLAFLKWSSLTKYNNVKVTYILDINNC